MSVIDSNNPAARSLQSLGFEDFRKMAVDDSLSQYEKVGFPDSFREGYDQAILKDIMAKVPTMQREGATLLDIGPGCSDLAQSIIESARSMDQLLILVDSQEMLSQLPEGEKVEKVPAFYPDCPELFARQQGNIDGIICYSVFQYIYAETNVWRFLDLTLGLLAPGGTLLIGDIPNRSMRNRFLASETGRAFHRSYMKNDSDPQIEYNRLSLDEIDDSVVCGLLMRARAAGFHGYVLPQPQDLPMANRREDLVIHRP